MSDEIEINNTQPLTLRQAREQAGLHVVALAAMLKVSVQKLEALEAGRYEELPDMTFARGLAASVCRTLKIDAASVLATLPQTTEVRLGQNDGDLNTPFPSAQQVFNAVGRSSLKSGASYRKPALLAVALLAVAAVAWWVLPVSEPAAGSDREVIADTPESNETPVKAVPPSGTVATQSMEPVPVATVAIPATVVLPTPPVESVAKSDATANPLLLLRARQSSWVQVRAVGGKVLLERNLPAGESVALNEEGPLAVVVGRGSEVDVAVRGQAMDLQPHIRNNVARFEVK